MYSHNIWIPYVPWICIGAGFSPSTSFSLANYFTDVSYIIILIIRTWYNRFNLGQSATDSLTLTLSCPCVPRQAVLTSHYVLPHNLDVVVTVWTCVLMPEANHMPQLMHYDPKLVTVLSNRNSLRTVATLSNKWTAPATMRYVVHTLTTAIYIFGTLLSMLALS
jgi:hypothetical protein